jgi:hypothetical protein
MKEAMKAVDQNGNYSFSDDTVDQGLLHFDFNAPAVWAERMQHELADKWRPYDDYRDYALNETPFIDPKSMLLELEKRGVLEVKGAASRRKGTFPEDKIERVLLHKSLL